MPFTACPSPFARRPACLPPLPPSLQPVPVVFLLSLSSSPSVCKPSHFVLRNIALARKNNPVVHFIGPDECADAMAALDVTFEPYSAYADVTQWFQQAVGDPVSYQVGGSRKAGYLVGGRMLIRFSVVDRCGVRCYLSDVQAFLLKVLLLFSPLSPPHLSSPPPPPQRPLVYPQGLL